MKCQKCGMRPANTHFTRILNGKKEELYLCDICAGENSELTELKSNFSSGVELDISDFLSGIFGNVSTSAAQSAAFNKLENICESCGMSFSEFSKTGKLGCSSCYSAFRNRLMGPLKQIHQNTEHTGKIPSRMGEEIKRSRRIHDLELQLNESVLKQDFETAVVLRDTIKELKGE